MPEIVIGNVEDIDLKKKFDVVLAFGLLDYLSNQGRFLENVKKHLKKDGLFLVENGNCESLHHRIRGFDPDTERCYDVSTVLRHNRFTIRRLLERHGFEIIKIYNYSNTRSLPRKVLSVIMKLRQHLNDFVFIVSKQKN